jgi:hypothetical protein
VLLRNESVGKLPAQHRCAQARCREYVDRHGAVINSIDLPVEAKGIKLCGGKFAARENGG